MSLRAEFLAPPPRTEPESGGPGRTTKRSTDPKYARSRPRPSTTAAVGMVAPMAAGRTHRVVTHVTVDAARAGEMLEPRSDMVLERAIGPGLFEAAEGPM